MNLTEYRRLKKQIEDTYKRTIETAQKDRLNQLAALDVIWKMSYKPRPKRNLPQSEQPIDIAFVKHNQDSPNAIYGTLIETLRKSLSLVSPDNFICDDVVNAMEKISGQKFNYSSVANGLKRLLKENVIEMISKGHGRTPARYRIKKTETNTETKEKKDM
jgi:hypothetical protein